MSAPIHCGEVFELIERSASGSAIFVEWSDATLSYAALNDDIKRCCALFDDRNLKHGDRVLILCGREREAIVTFVAALLDGLVPVMLTPDTPEARARSIAELTEAALIVTDQNRLTNESWMSAFAVIGVQDSVSSMGALFGKFSRATQSTGSFQSLLASMTGRRPRCAAKPDDLAYILFTSGTTSAPKGVMVTHKNLFTHLETISRLFSYGPASRIFNGMVLAHADGLVQGPLLALANGCRLIRPQQFTTQSIEQHLNMVRARQATHFLSVPAIYALIDRYAKHDDYFNAPEFVGLVSVAAKLDEKLWQRLETRFQRPIFNMYGLTETVTAGLYAGPHSEMGPIGTIGKAIDIDVRLVRPDGTDAPAGEPGEIWLRGTCVSPGYYRSPDETAERYSGDWLKTADVAIHRPDGAYAIVGRIKTVIMHGGFLIRPEEIDEALISHPAVVEAATVGLSDPDFGEVPVSAVVLDAAADENELTAHCAQLLETKKVPRRIIALPSIPRGDAKKVQTGALREVLKERVQCERMADADSSLESTILDVASKTFRTPAAQLSLESSPKSVARWDSFAHITLIHNVEARLGIRLPTSDVVNIDNLQKLAETVRRLSEGARP